MKKLTATQLEVFTYIVVRANSTQQGISRDRDWKGRTKTTGIDSKREKTVDSLFAANLITTDRDGLININPQMLMNDDAYFNLVASIRQSVQQNVEKQINDTLEDYDNLENFMKKYDIEYTEGAFDKRNVEREIINNYYAKAGRARSDEKRKELNKKMYAALDEMTTLRRGRYFYKDVENRTLFVRTK